jgi:hypothetical protein
MTTRRIGWFFSPQMRDWIGNWDPYAILATLPADITAGSRWGRDQYVEAHT